MEKWDENYEAARSSSLIAILRMGVVVQKERETELL